VSVRSVKVLGWALSSSKTPAAVKVRAAVEVLKMTANPPEGPTEVEDARMLINVRNCRRRNGAEGNAIFR
jgi:hypothetical protein